MSDAAPLVDFDAAYDNSAAVPGADRFAPRWALEAAAFREAILARGRAELDIPYANHARQRYDLFLPDGEPQGLAVFVHGGYWKALDKSSWSHLARGPLERGHAVAIPSYRLAPDARLTEISADIGACLAHAAARIAGPIRLAGHSAGGHLVARMAAAGAPVPDAVAERIALVLPVSGLHDLRPLRRTRMNDVLGIDATEATTESPALLEPALRCPVHALVGARENPELRRQSAFLVSSWHGLGGRVALTEVPDRHHFDVIESLADPAGLLARLLTGAAAL